MSFLGHHPIRSKGDYSKLPGLNFYFAFACPRSPRLAPWLSYVYLPMNSLVIIYRRELQSRSNDLNAHVYQLRVDGTLAAKTRKAR
jgi:hypothetical protein